MVVSQGGAACPTSNNCSCMKRKDWRIMHKFAKNKRRQLADALCIETNYIQFAT